MRFWLKGKENLKILLLIRVRLRISKSHIFIGWQPGKKQVQPAGDLVRRSLDFQTSQFPEFDFSEISRANLTIYICPNNKWRNNNEYKQVKIKIVRT